jgi:predicted transcriptional regulator
LGKRWRKLQKRDSHEILVTMLEIAKKGIVKTRIMQGANLSYDQLKTYLELLSSHGFIKKTVDDKREIWKTTKKGLGVIEACQICQLIFKEMSKSANESLNAKFEK